MNTLNCSRVQMDQAIDTDLHLDLWKNHWNFIGPRENIWQVYCLYEKKKYFKRLEEQFHSNSFSVASHDDPRSDRHFFLLLVVAGQMHAFSSWSLFNQMWRFALCHEWPHLVSIFPFPLSFQFRDWRESCTPALIKPRSFDSSSSGGNQKKSALGILIMEVSLWVK